MKRWTIGNIRRQRADIRLNDETVSGLHASLTQTDSGRWMLEDQNSLNGTFRASNGHWIQIRQSEVGIDDHLRFGRAETTVRQLLKLSPPPASPPASPSGEQDVVSWWSDLAIGLSKITNFAEFRKNVMFVFDLISSPGRKIMRCAVRRHPVNPFSFMLFGGLLYNLITTSGLTISSIIDSGSKDLMVSLVTKFRDTLPISSLIFILTLVFNILPFAVFKYFSLKKRYFDDFMRLMAVVQGMFWMQASFLTLFINQLVTEFSTRPIADFRLNVQVLLVYILGAVTITYLVSFGIVAQKHFWNISYGRTLWCYALTVLAFFVIMLLMFSPVIAINMVIALGNRRY